MDNGISIAIISSISALLGAGIGSLTAVGIEWIKAKRERDKDHFNNITKERLNYRSRVKELIIQFLTAVDPDLHNRNYDKTKITSIMIELQLELNLENKIDRRLNDGLNRIYVKIMDPKSPVAKDYDYDAIEKVHEATKDLLKEINPFTQQDDAGSGPHNG